MYTLAGALSDVTVAAGSNILVLGPAMSGKKAFAYEVLADGADDGEGAIIVTMSDGAERVESEFANYLNGTPDSVPLAIVDSVSRQQGVEDLEDDERVKYTSSPVDMTGIGICLSEFIETFHVDQDLERNRVCLNSISTLLMYSDLQTVFRFLHVFTGRIQNVDALGLYLMDPTAHDEQTLNTLKGLFDGVVNINANGEDPTFDGASL